MRVMTQLRFIQEFDGPGISLRDEEQFVGEPAALVPMFERKHGLDVTQFPTAPVLCVSSPIYEKDERANEHDRERQMPARMPPPGGNNRPEDGCASHVVPRGLRQNFA